MPILPNARHESFAQALPEGKRLPLATTISGVIVSHMDFKDTYNVVSWWTARIVCYAAFFALLGSFIVYWAVFEFDLCKQAGDTGLRCDSQVLESIGSISIAYFVSSIFMVLPALLALIGLVMIIKDLVALARRPRQGND